MEQTLDPPMGQTAKPLQPSHPQPVSGSVYGSLSGSASFHGELSPLAAASSPEAHALRMEIITVGRKLWERQYVDGNGGNISVRLRERYLLCTPTMMSKRDMEPSDICL